MQFDMDVENINNDGSEQASTSDDGQFLFALRKMMKKEVEAMVIRTVQQVIVPKFEGLVRTVVTEELQSVEKRLLARNANEVERRLQLKFSEEVFEPVLTGKPLKGKGGDSLKVELVDSLTGRVVETGPLSSAKVEILVLDASNDDNFNNSIIREGDKKRPHFSKNIRIDLKEGGGDLRNVKLGHNSDWMKSCKCRLGAKIIGDFKGVHVQEGRTDSFMVVDCRSQQYKKHYPPSLSDEVWRLDNIGRDGAPCKRLKKEKVETVGDFLFLLSLDPCRLQKLVGAGAKWSATVDHARTCAKDDKVYLHYPSPYGESKMGVIFDAVGELKGIINDSHYVAIDNLSADEEERARGLLLSAFKNREARTPFDDEASLLKQFPCRSSDINSPTNSSVREGPNGNDLSVSDYSNWNYEPVEVDMSSQGNDAFIRMLDHANNNDHFGVLASTDTGQMHGPIYIPLPSSPFPDIGTSSQCTITAFDNLNSILHFASPGSPLHEPHAGVQSPSYYLNIDSNNLSEILRGEAPSCQQNNARAFRFVPVAKAKIWVLRAKKRVMTLGGIHAHKKLKT